MNFTPSLAPELAGLPTPQVLETLRFETVFDALLRDFQVRYPQYSALLASDPAIKLIEVAAYRELLLRARINEAARANLLAFAVGNDLEHLGAFYGVTRLPLKTLQPHFTLQGQFHPAGPRVGQAHAGELEAGLPAAQRLGGGGVKFHGQTWRDGLIDQFRQARAVVAAHHPGVQGRGEDVGNALAQVVEASEGLAGVGVEAIHRKAPPSSHSDKCANLRNYVALESQLLPTHPQRRSDCRWPPPNRS